MTALAGALIIHRLNGTCRWAPTAESSNTTDKCALFPSTAPDPALLSAVAFLSRAVAQERETGRIVTIR
jgi:hypothetical protein